MAETLNWENHTWKSWVDTFKEENEHRIDIDPNKLCSYGIKPLDDALFRIGKNELVVIGAETGQGKSELTLSIAQHNAKNGKHVAVYYLEGGQEEAIRRMKWRDITDEYYKNYYHIKTDIDFRHWMFNDNQHPIIHEIESKVYLKYKEEYKDNLHFYPVSKGFTLDNLIMALMDFQELLSKNLYLDLIVIDHLQYFSLDHAENEISEITKILRKVKEITEYYSTPVILVSHLRKRGNNKGLPTHEDFYGSGNIAKISTTAIMVSPSNDQGDFKYNIYPTFFRIVKSGVGIRPSYAMLCNFNLNVRKYDDSYEVYRTNSMGEVKKDPIPDNELPKWARRVN